MTKRARRAGDEGGAAAVEFALICIVLFTVLFGIIVLGLLLSKRQVVTQAANEGARAGVGVAYTVAPGGDADVVAAARQKVDAGLRAVDRSCSDPTVTCSFDTYSCAGGPGSARNGLDDCLSVRIEIQVKGAAPLVPNVGLIDPALPDTMVASAIVRLSPQT